MLNAINATHGMANAIAGIIALSFYRLLQASPEADVAGSRPCGPRVGLRTLFPSI
jgi:hypothetical protein